MSLPGPNASSSQGNLPPQPRVQAAWYVACHSADLRRSPVTARIFDQPLVLWRAGDGSVGCMLDRCPHRSVPLSEGRVVGDELQCAYHGWRFSTRGEVTRVPALDDPSRLPTRCTTRFPVREQQGLIWVWMDPETEPTRDPFTFPAADAPGYTTVRKALYARGSVHQVIENALDVPHTAFLHGGLFRSDDAERNRIQVKVRRWADRCEAEYIGEPRPGGLAGRLLSPSGGQVTHFDRFYLPSITEVEYRIGTENHIVLSAACTPHSDWETTMHAVVSVRTRFPGWLVKLIVQPVALRIFGQDAVMLAKQTDTIARFGEARFVSTELDALGPHIMALMRKAARGQMPEPETGDAKQVRDLYMRV